MEDIQTYEKDDVLFKCEISDPNLEVKWYKDNELVVSDHRIFIEATGKSHSLSIPWTQISDTGTFKAFAGFSKSIAQLTVKGNRLLLSRSQLYLISFHDKKR